ncbi:lipopolysaccharide biosynthesis protein [Sphingomonas sp. CFBP 13714]|uniref:lipopolysaccharide biosynthesis protein n=1 Tax=Sphingomonas sp. CFBP 13714 TaxID=2775308 RepID=UPI00177E1F3D|nr:lipopolysaccharide biosynthesis protein [Sphingomonas sp. CFBP 13714]MBD8699824.1 lipopolysaccharide biosynthesis protein [Sphingomonas sp. CFBP 13714]
MDVASDHKGQAPGSIRRSFLWAAIGQTGMLVIQFGSSVVLARILTPYELGVFAIALATVGMITAFQSLGLGNYLIRADVVDRDVLSSVFSVNILLSIAISAIIVAFGLLGQALFKDPGVQAVLFWIAWTPLINALSLVPTGLLQREGNFKSISTIRLISSLTGTICTVLFAIAGFSYMSLAYGSVITAVMGSVATCLVAPRHVQFRLGTRHWRDIYKFGSRMLMINGVVQMQNQVSNFALGNLSGLSALGLYSRANNLFSILSDNVHTVLARVLIADFAQIARDGAPLRLRYLRVLEFMTAILWPAFAGMAVLAGPMVYILYGAKWTALALPLAVLCFNGILWVSVTMAWELFVVAKETSKQARFEIIRATVGVALFVTGALFSLTGAMVGRVAEGMFAVFLYLPHIKRMTGSHDGDFLPIYRRSAVVTIAAICPPLLLMMWHGWDARTPFVQVAMSVVAGGLLWALALLYYRHPIITELRGLAARRRSA